jgi:hypothetical protein
VKPSPEFALAVESCRRNFPSSAATPIRPAPDLDWGRFVRLVRFHRIQGLVWSALAGEALPDTIASTLSADAKEIAAANLKAAAESALLQTRFEKANVDLLFFKGLTLSALAYRDAFIKMSSDIDILVRSEAVGTAAGVLNSMGYRPVVPADGSLEGITQWHVRNKESAWLNPERGLVVELHTALANNSRLIPALGINSPRLGVRTGRGPTLPTLSTGDLVAYLFVHGASTAWFRLKWLCDVCAILDGLGAEETELLFRTAISKGAGRAPAQALLLAERLFDLPLTPWLRDKILEDPVARFLATVAQRAMSNIEEPTSRFGGTLLFRLTQPFLLEGWGFAMNEMSRQVQDVARRRLRFR